MDLSNIKIISMYPHTLDDDAQASDSLMNTIAPQINGQLTRLTPHAFIYMSHSDDNTPCCHLVVSANGNHYVGGLDSTLNSPVSQEEPEENENESNETENDDESNEGDDNEDESEGQVASVQPSGDDSVTSDQSLISPVIPTTLTVPGEIMSETCGKGDDKDDMNEGCGKPVVESVTSDIDHMMEDLEGASTIMENAMKRKYGGTIVRHTPTSFTHIRSNGIVDRITTKPKSHSVYTHRISN